MVAKVHITVQAKVPWALPQDKLCHNGELTLRLDREFMCIMTAVPCGLTPIKRIMLLSCVSYC